jgi:carbamate kinase
VATVLTQVRVDPADPAFARPSKPVGPVYDADEVQDLAVRHHWSVAPDGEAGSSDWRRVVASPPPLEIIEIDAVRVLLDAGVLVVCAGGGGVPVAADGDRLTGVEAVVDKDATSALLAEQLGAERLVLLTDVDAVIDGWGTPEARPIGATTAAALTARTASPASAFAAGSMGPKVAAACSFVERTGGRAAIGSLDQLADVLAGRSGTQITR